MDVHSWPGAAVVAASALLLVLTAAAEAAAILAARNRTRLLSHRAAPRPNSVHRYAVERERLIAGLVLARLVCIVTGCTAATMLVSHHAGVTLKSTLATGLISIVAAASLEALPRVIVAHNPEGWCAALSPITNALRLIFLAPAYVLDLPAHALLRIPALHREVAEGDEEDEDLIRLVEMEESQGGIEEDEREMIRAVFELEDTAAREIMVSRIDITAIEAGASIQEVAALIAACGKSRIPVYQENIDNIVGVVYAKDVLARLAQGDTATTVSSIARNPLFVPETKRVDELLHELRQAKIHIAIVLDEYGGTAGLLTIEDLVEEIVGEIIDEYDQDEPTVERTDEGDVIVDARQNVSVLKDLFDLDVEPEDFDTVGGFVIHRLGRIPVPNDTVEVEGLRLHVLSVAGRRLRKIRISRLVAPVESTG